MRAFHPSQSKHPSSNTNDLELDSYFLESFPPLVFFATLQEKVLRVLQSTGGDCQKKGVPASALYAQTTVVAG